MTTTDQEQGHRSFDETKTEMDMEKPSSDGQIDSDLDREKALAAAPGTNSDQNNDDEKYPTGARLAIICTALCLNVLIVALSNTILATAIPTITAAFNSYDDIGWYTSGELITACAFQLPFGTAYSLLNAKWTFLASTFIYLIGSAVGGAAPNSVALIIGRTIQGVGNAGVLGGAFILIARNTPLRKRSLYTGLVAACFTIASVIGPLVGGAFTSDVSWRWCFYFNLPVGVLPIVMIAFFLPSSYADDSRELRNLSRWQIIKKFDPIGTILIIGAVVCLVLALQWGGGQYQWSDGRVIALLVVFGTLAVAWIVTQYFQGDDATVPFSVITQRTVICAIGYSLASGMSFAIMIYYIPIWFQSVQGDSAQISGEKQLALSLSVSLAVIVSGGLIVKIGYYAPFLIAGTVLLSVGSGLLYTINIDSSLGELIGYQILYGVGCGMGLNTATVAVQTVLPNKTMAKGISAELFTRLLGTALGAPIAQNVLQQALQKNLGPSVALQVFGDGSAAGALDTLQGIYGVGTQALRDALSGYNDAVTMTFMVALILSCLTLPFGLLVEWKDVRKEKKDEDDRREGRNKAADEA